MPAPTKPQKSPDANVEKVVDLLRSRSVVGLAKYRVTTERTDLTPLEWVRHWQADALSYDATGHLIRLAPIVAPDNFPSGLPDVLSKGLADFVHRIPGMALNYKPFPKPGDVGRTVAKGTTPLGPEEVPKSGYAYPRITADC